MPNSVTQRFSGLPLWERFMTLTTQEAENKKMVEDHLAFALPLLDNFIIAFPKYTLHNLQHQYNIIKLMGDLLSNELEKLTGLETAILLLSAIYHDIGMVFSQEELESIPLEAEFEEFLKRNPGARLQYEENSKQPSSELIEWYCRWMHAKRVWLFLNKAEQSTPFLWNGVPIKPELGYVCLSHNESVDFIKHEEKRFDINFLGQCDLTFCALILRLADIMDFDNSRTPQSVYEFLELNKSKKGSDAVSDEEWQKHLSSKGFTFQKENGRTKLLFIAVPEKPKVEISIRKFIKVIEAELYACTRLQKFCSVKWQNLVLPGEVNVDGIISRNYRSGNYHFSLSEANVMTLLSGESLYNDNYIFLRELLQNALDTSRHREFRESLTNANFHAQPIEVSYFTDVNGYQWVRIDDYGMGMNEEIIEKHLLKKGESYYNSDNFKLEKLLIQQKAHTDFVPISRFGIGLLSCFITGDRIEISTLHKDEPGNAYRLSVEGRDGFFMLQAKRDQHQPSPMPAEYGYQTQYRNTPGTSIAVRITTNKEYEGFNMKHQLESYLMAPPIPIKYNGDIIGGNFDELLVKPWAVDTTFELNDRFCKKVTELTGIQYSNGIRVKIISISITNNSLTTKLKGQFVILYVDAHPDKLLETPAIRPTFRLNSQEKKLKIQCIQEKIVNNVKTNEQVSEDISALLNDISFPENIPKSAFFPYERYYFGGIQLSHNGIRILGNQKLFTLKNNFSDSLENVRFSHNDGSFLSSGIIYFQDELLPDLTISRNEIKGLSFLIVAHLVTAARDIEKLIFKYKEQRKFDFFKEIDRNINYETGLIQKSGFYEVNQKFWDRTIILLTVEGEMSISDLVQKRIDRIQFHPIPYDSVFFHHFVNYILQANFDVSIEFSMNQPQGDKYYLSPKSSTLPLAIMGFEPLTFLRYANSKKSLKVYDYINLDHPYVAWFFRAYPALTNEYFYYSRQLIYALSSSTMSSNPDKEKINNILERLRIVLPQELRPPKEIAVTPKDFILNE